MSAREVCAKVGGPRDHANGVYDCVLSPVSRVSAKRVRSIKDLEGEQTKTDQ